MCIRDRTKENIREISEKMIATVCERLHNMNVELKVDDKALDLIAEKGFDEVYGACLLYTSFPAGGGHFKVVF